MATLIIKNSAHDGYRRAGHAFAHGENRLPLEGVTQDQIAALQNDPHLFVVVEADEAEIAAGDSLGAQLVEGANNPANHDEAAVAADDAPADGNTAAGAATPAAAGDAPQAAPAKPRAARTAKAKAE